MSSRTAMTIVDQAATPEDGPTTKTLENFDVTNGNKIENDGRTALQVRNTSAGALNLTYTYTERGQTRTRAVSIGANEETVLGPFPPAVFNQHAGDGENGTHLWVTAAGTAGQLKGRAIRFAPGLFT